MKDLIKKILKENEWDWAMESQPLELQDPRDWIGSSFGHGKPDIDRMTLRQIERGDANRLFTITDIDADYLEFKSEHPHNGVNIVDVKIKDFINKINNGTWVWK